MIVYRLAQSRYANDLTGKGAEIAGGRWNSRGIAMVYTAESRSLCTVEIAVHTPLGIIPKDYMILKIELPDDSCAILDPTGLQEDWNTFPWPNSTQKIGDSFIADARTLAMKVPSAVIEGDFNILINPAHPVMKDVRTIKMERFSFDERLFGQR